MLCSVGKVMTSVLKIPDLWGVVGYYSELSTRLYERRRSEMPGYSESYGGVYFNRGYEVEKQRRDQHGALYFPFFKVLKVTDFLLPAAAEGARSGVGSDHIRFGKR